MEESSQYIAATGKDDRNDEHPEDTPGLCDGNPHGKHRPYRFFGDFKEDAAAIAAIKMISVLEAEARAGQNTPHPA